MARYFGDAHPECWTYRPTETLPKKVVLDANVILDFCYIKDGLGRICLNYLYNNGFRLYTSSKCIAEAKKQVLLYNDSIIASLIESTVSQANIDIIDSTELPVAVFAINRHDRHVAAVAAHLEGFVLSDDIPLNWQLNSTNMHCRTMREVAFESFLPGLPPQRLSTIGYGLADAAGHALFKGIPHEDMCSDLDREWTFWENLTLGRLFYDSGRNQIIYCPAFSAAPVSTGCIINPNSQLSVLFNYRNKNTYTEITIKAKSDILSEESSSTFRINEIPSSTLERGEFRLMNSYQLGNGWKGDMQNFSYGPGRVSRNNWKIYSSLIGASPPNLTCDLTKFALSLTRVAGDRGSIPELSSVIDLAHFTMRDFYPAV